VGMLVCLLYWCFMRSVTCNARLAKVTFTIICSVTRVSMLRRQHHHQDLAVDLVVCSHQCCVVCLLFLPWGCLVHLFHLSIPFASCLRSGGDWSEGNHRNTTALHARGEKYERDRKDDQAIEAEIMYARQQQSALLLLQHHHRRRRHCLLFCRQYHLEMLQEGPFAVTCHAWHC